MNPGQLLAWIAFLSSLIAGLGFLGAVGGRGVISVLANILPGEVRKLWDHINAFDLADACTQHLRLFPLCRGMFVETNPIPIKAAMAMAGMIQNELRLPLTPLSAAPAGSVPVPLSVIGVSSNVW